jgi:uncharacterized protein
MLMSNGFLNQRASAQLPTSMAGGIRFRCTECGDCCSGAPGKVRVSAEEIQRISEFRKVSEVRLRASEICEIDGETLLRERPNGDCVFFENNRCLIHPVKPRQCRTYPFWFRNVRSEAAWQKTCGECPGIGEGEWFSPEEIVATIEGELGMRN